MKQIASILACLSLLLVLAACQEETPVSVATDAAAGLAKAVELPGVVPPGSAVAGKSYAEWSAAWWQWLISIPIAENPGLDTDGSLVALNQSGHVWFLAPNYGMGQVDVRYATIPPGKMLFIDIAAFVGSEVIGDPADPDELRAVLSASVDAIVDVSFTVDGRPLEDLAPYRIQSPLFPLAFPENNVFGVEPGTYYPAAAEGYYAMLAPLPVGEHTIHIRVDFGEVFGVSDVTFHLTVAPAGRGGRPRT
ncbi:MAG: hypothetical protein R6X35_05105 [Candidatus Krumholzibacteriia bacterium]